MKKLLPIQYARVLYETTHDRSGAEFDRAVWLFIHFLRKQQSFHRLPYILKEFDAYAKEQSGVRFVEVTSPTGLTSNMRRAIASYLGEKLELTEVVDPSLMGGVTVRTGSIVIDASVKSQMKRFTDQLIHS